VWKTTVNGKPLHFRLCGINNQNFIMCDEETGSWWQQVSGKAILGALKGTQLEAVPQDELTFTRWRFERPNGRVLRPDPQIERAGKYAEADWEANVAKLPVVTPGIDKRLAPREIVIGVTVNGAAKAYPFRALQQQSPIVDTIGITPVVIVLGDDGQSVRAFTRVVDGKTLDLFARPDSKPLVLVDADTGTEWDFAGRALRGTHAGKQLQQVNALRDYWFDWQTYHRGTGVYSLR
jgi:hypothetical protein